MHRTVIIEAPDRVIVKIPHTLSDPGRAVRRAEKKLGCELRILQCKGDCNIYSNHPGGRYREGGSYRGPVANARLAQSIAMRRLVNTWSLLKFSHANPPSLWADWIDELRAVGKAPPVALRYAFNPDAYTAPAVAPKLP